MISYVKTLLVKEDVYSCDDDDDDDDDDDNEEDCDNEDGNGDSDDVSGWNADDVYNSNIILMML